MTETISSTNAYFVSVSSPNEPERMEAPLESWPKSLKKNCLHRQKRYHFHKESGKYSPFQCCNRISQSIGFGFCADYYYSLNEHHIIHKMSLFSMDTSGHSTARRNSIYFSFDLPITGPWICIGDTGYDERLVQFHRDVDYLLVHNRWHRLSHLCQRGNRETINVC